MYKKVKNNKIKFIFGLILFITLNFTSIPSFLTHVNNDNIEFNNVKSSGIYYDIVIDDLPSSSTNWAWAETQPWFGGGSGTSGNPYIIEDHTFESTGSGDSFRILNSRRYFIIRNCTFINSGGSDNGLYLSNITNGQIISNQIINNYIGAYLSLCNDTIISDNLFYVNDFYGILIAYSHFNTISDNNASFNAYRGIRVYQSTFNIISENDVYDNGIWDGIQLTTYSNNNTVSGNIIANSGDHGIELNSFSLSNIIRGNTIINHGGEGIYIYSGCNYNLLHENILKNNGLHAVDDGSNNYWNNTLIGNYWDNYTGYDMDLDGIGDAPYNFIGGSAGSIDYLPIWNIQAPISIEDLPSSPNNWAWAVTQAWCTGAGTSGDPYIIEDLIIDGEGADNCILVRNSNKHFIIRNCKVYNAGTIMFASGLQLFNVTNSQLIGNNASNNEFSGIILLACYNNTISGNTANKNTGYGLILGDCHNNTISGNIANENINEHGIFLGGSQNNTITGNSAIDNGAYGIRLEASSFNFLSANSVNNNSNSGIYLLDSSNNNTILETTAYFNDNNGIYCVDSNNNTIEDTIAHYNKHNGIYLQNSNNTRILKNEFSDSVENGIKMELGYETWIEGTSANDNGFNGIYSGWGDFNTFKDTIAIGNGHNGIYIQYNNNCTLLENTLSNSTENGLKMDFCTENWIEGTIANDNTFNGIYGWTVNNNTIKDSSASDNGHNGVFLQISNDNVIKHNNLYESDENGIKFQLCQNNIIFDNYLFSNVLNGILMEVASINNIIYDNVISDNNDKGISIASGCNDNLFYKNFFLENRKHAFDDGLNNDWNSTIIGNYWDNWTSPDESPQDGIVDYPYKYIFGSANSVDYFPIADDTSPTITINSPTEDDIFGIIAPDYNVSITDDYLEEMWYTLDGGLTNYTFTEFTGTINQSAWEGMPDDIITLTFYASDKPGNIGSAEVTIIKDTQAPVISINSPEDDDVFGTSAPTFNVRITDDNLDSMWYTLDGGLNNYTFSDNETINPTAWADLIDGPVTITFYANDTFGRLGSAEVTIIKDTQAPVISINSPVDDDLFGTDSPNYDVTITDTYLFEMWYTLDGGLHNYTFTEFTGIIDQSAWEGMPDDMITLTFYASDKAGNEGSADVIVEKDTQAPTIIINSPTTGATFGANAPSFTVEISDDNLDSIWYSLDGGLTNFTFTANDTINQAAWTALPEGSVTITFYANDTLGNIASESVNIEKDLPASGDDFIIIIIVISIVSGAAIVTIILVVVLRKRKAGEEV